METENKIEQAIADLQAGNITLLECEEILAEARGEIDARLRGKNALLDEIDRALT